MEELLRIEGIRFRYDHNATALDDVSLTFYKGERVAVLGNNGAGKSTFFRCCNSVLRPESGKILLNGQEITDNKQDIIRLRQAVGLVFQEPDSQIIAGTVEDEISFGPMNLQLAHSEVLTRVTDSMELMNLCGFEKRAPQYLSGGEKKRVTIADILAMRPQLILLDEPTASLDPDHVERLEATLDELSNAGITLAVSTHDVDFAYRFSNRAVVFCGGKIIADDDMEKVFSSDDILAAARLKKPLIFEVAKQLSSRFHITGPEKLPKSIAELREYINALC